MTNAMVILETEGGGGSNLGTYILIGVGVIFVLWAISAFNRLVRLRNGVKTAWSDIDVQLQRRYDLIPNLVEIAKGYMKHEKELLENVTAARSGALNALKQSHDQGMPTPQLMSAEANMGAMMSRFMLQVENYPDLKANTNMMQLTEEVATTENKVSFARQYYNDSVQRLNNLIEAFPSNVIAKMFGFVKANFFEVQNREQVGQAPKISF
jgi:LemA protein